jgi:mannose-6-phosphate isomerase-like protein (cupin superfamily)
MTNADRSRVIRLSEAQLGVPALRCGTLDVKLSAPTNPNQQKPHTQDELYIIVRGRGSLFHDGKRDPFEAGAVLFVAAGIEHHFEEFSEGDLVVWRVFYGPDGGEIPAGSVP